MHVLIATDAWKPQINGVVRSLEAMAAEAGSFGASVSFLTPDQFRSFPLPTYSEIRLAFASPSRIETILNDTNPAHVHIATEGPIGFATRRACLRQNRAFTTSYHTRFPEYLSARLPVPEAWSYAVLRRFHGAARATMVSTHSLEKDLRQRGFKNIVPWTRGVNTDLFRPRDESVFDLPRPIFLYVGRVSVEKNIEAFLKLKLPGSKVVIGDGPARTELESTYQDAHFAGSLTGEELAKAYASSDVFVFPSRTDTFGIVLIEALASGLPIAAYPVMGPLDIIGDSNCGILGNDLKAAALAALRISREECRSYGERFTWHESARQFFSNIAEIQGQSANARAIEFSSVFEQVSEGRRWNSLNNHQY